MSAISEEQVKNCQLLFNLMDSDKDSCVLVDQVEDMCKSLGACVDADDLNDFKNEHSEGKVNFDQFYKFFLSQVTRKMNKAKLIAAFEFIDKGKSGTIPTNELKHGLMVLGETLSADEATELLKKYDNGGKVDYKKLANDFAE